MFLTRKTELNPERREASLVKLVTGILIITPILVYLCCSFLYSGPIFYGDDFDLLETVTLAPEATTLAEKFRYWTKQQNEHRVIIPRLIAFLDYRLEGFLHWRSVILVANLLWCGILFFFWKAFRSLSLPAWLFIPVPWILFQPQYYENMTWATSILQQSDVVFWLSFTVYLFARGLPKAALIPAVIATFSHGSGLSAFPVILGLILIRREWRLLPYWGASAAIIILFYFYGLQKGQSANLAGSLSDPLQLIQAFFAFSGSLTRLLLAAPYWAVAAGVLMMLVVMTYLLPALFRAFKTGKPGFFDTILMGNIAFFVISAALVSVSRSWAGLESIMPPRYQHYTVFLACWTYLVLLRVVPVLNGRKILATTAIAGALLFNALSYIVYTPFLIYRRDFLVADEANYLRNKSFLQYHWSFNRNIRPTYRKAVEKGVIRMSDRMPHISGNAYPADSSCRIRFSATFDDKPTQKDTLRNGILWIEGEGGGSGSDFLYFSAISGEGYWVPVRKSRPAFRDLVFKGRTRGDTFRSELDYTSLPMGEYRVGMLKEAGFSWTPTRLEIFRDSLAVR